ncbi:PLDc N-terminal domain-containing protein [Paracoccus sp. Ld10]|uniref:PLDc N-terminal domain-containing protein n=1 Tax=Paracoccus sp. Ld10 TaxID=649158 RepID=UPI00386D1417
MGWLFSIIIFALDVWAIAQIINTGASNKAKILWILLIVILPVVGLIIWYFAGPKSNVRM